MPLLFFLTDITIKIATSLTVKRTKELAIESGILNVEVR